MGFTLLEVSVAITLSLLIVGLAYGAYALSAQLVSRWKQQLQAENELHLFTRRFSREVRTARGVRQQTERDLVLYRAGGDSIIYKWEEGTLFRRGTPAPLPSVELESGTFAVQHVEGRAFVELLLPARLPGITGSPVSRQVQVGVATRLPPI